jgi:hypothetical protein
MTATQTAAPKKTAAPRIKKATTPKVDLTRVPRAPKASTGNSAMEFAVQQLTTPVAATLQNPMAALVAQAQALAEPKPAKPARVTRLEQNGVKRPLATGGICDQMWSAMERITAEQGTPCTIAQAKAACTQFNQTNLMGEYASWRKFNGITGRLPTAPKAPKAAQVVMSHEGNP